MSSSEAEKKKDVGSDRVGEVFRILSPVYSEPRPLLAYTNPFELLIATILAAQCTDERVNKVTPTLFGAYPTSFAMGKAPREKLEEIIKSTGFFHNKAKSISEVSKSIASQHKGVLPTTVDELSKLPGVGRKTASVVAGNCFGANVIIVDTHFKRVCLRLGLVETDNPDRIEREIKDLLPEDSWTRFSLVINYHGRYRCTAKKPQCPSCEVNRLCPYDDKTK